MNYQINVNGSTYALPTYNIKIMQMLDEQERKNNDANVDILDKLKSLYNTCESLIPNLSAIIGSFDSLDPNELNLVYLNIIQAYSAPVNSHNNDEAKNKIQDALSSIEGADKMIELMEKLEKLNLK